MPLVASVLFALLLGGPAAAADGALTVVALGDSTAVGYGGTGDGYVGRLFARVARVRPQARLVNLAQNGATVSSVLRAQAPRVTEAGLVTIGVGGNDVVAGTGSAEFQRKYEAIVEAVRRRTPAPIVVATIPDLSLAAAVPSYARAAVAARIDALNAALRAVASRHGLTVFDAHAMSRRELPAHPEYLSADGFHPSDAGYQAWADEMWKVVRPLVAARP